MDKSAPLPPLRNQKPTWDKAADLAPVGGSISWRNATLEKMLAAGRFAAQAEKLRLYKSIATI